MTYLCFWHLGLSEQSSTVAMIASSQSKRWQLTHTNKCWIVPPHVASFHFLLGLKLLLIHVHVCGRYTTLPTWSNLVNGLRWWTQQPAASPCCKKEHPSLVLSPMVVWRPMLTCNNLNCPNSSVNATRSVSCFTASHKLVDRTSYIVLFHFYSRIRSESEYSL